MTGRRTAGGCACCATARTWRTTSPRRRQTSARWSPFAASDNSWHGHKPFIGPRRVLQMNWVTSEGVAQWQKLRHRLSAAVKRLTPARAPTAA